MADYSRMTARDLTHMLRNWLLQYSGPTERVFGPALTEIRRRLEALAAAPQPVDAPGVDGCPCHYTRPCHPLCSCVDPLQSRGCERCAKYGSLEQRRAAAETIAYAVQAAHYAVIGAQPEQVNSLPPDVIAQRDKLFAEIYGQSVEETVKQRDEARAQLATLRKQHEELEAELKRRERARERDLDVLQEVREKLEAAGAENAGLRAERDNERRRADEYYGRLERRDMKQMLTEKAPGEAPSDG